MRGGARVAEAEMRECQASRWPLCADVSTVAWPAHLGDNITMAPIWTVLSRLESPLNDVSDLIFMVKWAEQIPLSPSDHTGP